VCTPTALCVLPHPVLLAHGPFAPPNLCGLLCGPPEVDLEFDPPATGNRGMCVVQVRGVGLESVLE
jgi:hypothetical protein